MAAGTVVIGVGNPLCGDDAAGRAVIRSLKAAGVPTGVELVESDGDPATLIELWQGRGVAVVVDAVRSGVAPGSVHHLELPGMAAVPPGTSSHGLGLAEAVGIAAAVGRLPRRLVVFGIEAGGCEPGTDLSAPVARAAEALAEEIRRAMEPELVNTLGERHRFVSLSRPMPTTPLS